MKELMTNANEISTPKFCCKELGQATEKIVTNLKDVQQSTLAIAGILGKVKTEKLWQDDFKSFTEYAEQTFSFKKAKTSQLAAIGEKFVNINDKFEYQGLKVNADFSYSQLLELRNESVDDINEMLDNAEIGQNMTTKRLREIEDSKKENSTEPNISSPVDIFIKAVDRALKKFKESEPTDKDLELYLSISEVLNKYNS